MLSKFFEESIILTADDRGVYYIRQFDDKIYWVGESSTGKFVNIFRGNLHELGSEDIWEGFYFDVPKGITSNFGKLKVRVFSAPDNPNQFLFQKVDSSVRYGAKNWNIEKLEKITPLEIKTIIEFPVEKYGSLTGIWESDDEGIYYITEADVPELGAKQVVWFAEHPDAQLKIANNQSGYKWANVFFGFFDNNVRIIRGEWVDIPKGKHNNTGKLTLELIDNDFMKIKNFEENSSPYRGSFLKRIKN